MAAWVGNTGKKMGIGNHLLADPVPLQGISTVRDTRSQGGPSWKAALRWEWCYTVPAVVTSSQATC